MVLECENLASNRKFCNCTYERCSRKGNCCACIQYHLSLRELPACAFPDEVEKSWDRSFRKFIETYK
ncbi:MAG: hypothetical protein JXB45_07625 [Candidatus Krumholzibacteriota bacterium]|nr:hypothetical protein [Candidatus Krumholzibacteriota bacterium]